MRGGEIKALTGLRIIAAFWVVLFHFRPLLEQAAPGFRSALNPILNCGAQGVDLFFILSGFVLTWNYLDRMGHRWSTRETLHFLWLRLARVWPVYLVTMHLAALWVIFTMHVGHVPERIDTFDATNYVRQLFMVQLWFRPYFDLSSWNGPAWSISAEWLAYLLFGGLVLVIFRMAHATRARSLMVLAVVASLPPVMLLLLTGQFYTPWSWLPRIVMQFTAGALACAAVSRLKLSHRSRHIAGYTALLIVAAIVGALYFLDAHPISGVVDSSGVVDVLFVPLVMALAIGIGPLPTLLSTRIMVYGGQISFGLYMVHELVHVSWTWATKQFELSLLDPGGGWIVSGLLVIAVVLSMALYHWVEEPGRRWMRRMIGVTKPAITDHHVPHNGHKHQVPADVTDPDREPVSTGVTSR
ncbi:acyltransferase [Mycobacteroides sp. H001]|uniref:acyltransferase family protein n=1 Tax=Mycobacteroides TaxID=670516 RepID=UPI00071263B3|nr:MULTISPECIES: acyltransferase [Mycobacteroides]KRQ24212.1 acyltransferase [Mycobacteroides sp. H072]KRQ32228.1 acyltransferase [Mycobacteroides sp. H002]KRQ47779.1 acyltransferase [Mycobacteroides sp. H054]KRQ73311.1 acyltransferase [Mycobacteroides sp. H001]OHU33135.1 acyltransferase [Mycobacteroides chelonae]